MIIFIPLVVLVIAAVMSNNAILDTPLAEGGPIAPTTDQRLRRILFILTFVLGIGGVIPLMGIPGAPWLLASEPLARAVCPAGTLGGFGADASWPSAMMIAMAWPACFMPLYRLIRTSTSGSALATRTAAALIVAAGYGVGLGLLMYLLYCLW